MSITTRTSRLAVTLHVLDSMSANTSMRSVSRCLHHFGVEEKTNIDETGVAAEEEQTREHEEREQFLQEQTTRERATREQTAREQTISPTLTSLPKLHSKLPLPIPREPKLYWKDDTPFMSGVDPRGMKRTAEFNEDHHPAKRHQLNPFEPPAEPQLSSITQIRQASEDWLTHPLPRLLPRPIAQPRTRLPSTRFDMAGASRDEFRPHFSHERIELPPIAPVVSPPSGNMSAFDALLWASKIRANELAPTPSQSGSQSRSRSISPNTTPDESAVGDLYEAGPGAKSNPALA